MEGRDGERLRDGIRTPVQLESGDGVRVQEEVRAKGVIRVRDGLELGKVRGQKWQRIIKCWHL